jgi:hypothetical protein
MASKPSEIRSGLLIPNPDPDFLYIPDPGIKSTGSRIRIRNTGGSGANHFRPIRIRIQGFDDEKIQIFF